MALYNTGIRDGLAADHALRQALPHPRGEFGLDPAGTPLHYRLAVDADHLADTSHRADDPTTPHVDGATTGQRQAAQLTAGSAAERARALTVLAFPVALPEAMATAPKAATAMLALPAPPVRRQLTATPPLTRQQPQPATAKERAAPRLVGDLPDGRARPPASSWRECQAQGPVRSLISSIRCR